MVMKMMMGWREPVNPSLFDSSDILRDVPDCGLYVIAIVNHPVVTDCGVSRRKY